MNKMSHFFIRFISHLHCLHRMFSGQIFLLNVKTYKGAFFHLFWSCDHIQPFWKEVQVIQEITSERFLSSPSFYFLNHTSDIFFHADTKSLLTIPMFLAKKCNLLWGLHPRFLQLPCGYHSYQFTFLWRN